MTDRELLEAAARAAGYEIHIWGDESALNVARMDIHQTPRWNPLTDDGDALRLAVKLRLEIRPDFYLSPAVITAAGDGCWEEVEIGTGTREEATRRAVVRAAAALAKEKP